MKIKYLGHAAILIETKSFKALIDPFLSGNPQYIESRSDIEGITHIFITHAHGDHIGDTEKIALNNDSLIICNAELGSILYQKNRKLKIHTMHIGGSYSFPFGRVKMTPAVHGSGYHEGKTIIDGGNPAGFLVDIDGKKVYHAGDTGLTYDMKLLEDEKIDIAFLPIGGNYTMDISDAVKSVNFIKPQITVPIHYNTFPVIQANPLEFKQRLLKNNVVIMRSSDIIEI